MDRHTFLIKTCIFKHNKSKKIDSSLLTEKLITMQAKTILASVKDFTHEIAEKLNHLGIGVELSEFSLPENLYPDELKRRMLRVYEALKDFKGRVTMHGVFYNMQIMARDPWIVEVCYKRMMQSLEIADTLGARRIVFHANYIPFSDAGHRERFLQAHLNYWPRLLGKAEEYGIQLLLENTQEPDASYITDILDAIDSPYLYGLLDTGHTNCFTDSNIPLDEWVRGFGKHLAYVHLHSNHGVKDEHIAYMDGNQDFSKFFPALDALPQYPWIIIEVKSREAFERSVEGLQGLGIL